ncbi:hypothetical protein [Candidatus Marimicrobium litorale]|uniref:Tetratricopeptide repeat protein n=1 Tax=Candidatus Marimicrobium litorale TaxID=2518991 RepID=A0ABT3T2C2_9GAMM|nr:hypothetical protein [Candidatus Marimicrobium litorale]MCX2975995.1 hypothetical protein [Candidatus Marimicrobium litorale]
MPVSQNKKVIVVCLVLLLQGCAAQSTQTAGGNDVDGESVPELNLNLPDQTDTACACSHDKSGDHNLLEKGLRALMAGDHREAVNYFRRYQRLESSPEEGWEAEVAVAYDKMLPSSPYYNPDTASESYRRLVRRQPDPETVHPYIRLLLGALANFTALHRQIDDLQNEKDDLTESLEKREEALKRLRELTLGQ